MWHIGSGSLRLGFYGHLYGAAGFMNDRGCYTRHERLCIDIRPQNAPLDSTIKQDVNSGREMVAVNYSVAL